MSNKIHKLGALITGVTLMGLSYLHPQFNRETPLYSLASSPVAAVQEYPQRDIGESEYSPHQTQEEIRVAIDEFENSQERLTSNGLGYNPEDMVSSDLDLSRYLDFTCGWEGFVDHAYRDSKGLLTVGCGTLIDPLKVNEEYMAARFEKVGLDYYEVISGNQRVTWDQSMDLAIDSLQDAVSFAKESVSNYNEQPDEVKLILVDMVYNLGRKGFTEFKNTILSIEKENYALAGLHMADSLWFCQTGRRAVNHVNTMFGISGFPLVIDHDDSLKC